MADEQGAIFLASEGDRWFSRNADALADPALPLHDVPLRMLELATSYRPRRVLEIGCSTGWRLAALRDRYDCAVTGVEPSTSAIEEGKRRYGADFDLRRGLSGALPIPQGESFDLVIAAFVFHWVSRDALVRSIAEVDRVLDDGGHLVLFDFFPDAPTRRRYHHLSDGQAYTYKQEISRAFLGTELYRHVGRTTSVHAPSAEFLTLGATDPGLRVVCDVLRRDTSAYHDGD